MGQSQLAKYFEFDLNYFKYNFPKNGSIYTDDQTSSFSRNFSNSYYNLLVLRYVNGSRFYLVSICFSQDPIFRSTLKQSALTEWLIQDVPICELIRVFLSVFSTESGWDNPFRPGGDLSREADQIVELIKGGKPITPTPGSQAPDLPSGDSSLDPNHTVDSVDTVSPKKVIWVKYYSFNLPIG